MSFNYIHIAFRGEAQGATRTLYSYSPAGSDIDPAWGNTMVEPGAAVKRFLNATECYVLQESELGHYISLITRNTLVPERGYMMISLLIENGCALTGRQVMGAFNALKKVFVEEENLNDDAVETALLEAGVPKEPVMLEAWRYTPSEQPREIKGEAAYRTYISVQELESIFSFPGQPEYADYRCILVVSATTSLRPGVKMPRITVAIRKQYGVVCPEGVTASAPLVYDGDRLVLTYSKEGFNSHTETVVVGNPAAYTKYEGSTIQVRTAAQTGIRFIRRIPIKVTSTKGVPLNGYTISVNGHAVSTVDPYIDFTERDLDPEGDVEIQVASNNYRLLKLKRPSAEMLTTEELVLELQPVEQGVTLRLDFGDGRVFEQQISIEKNTAEYNRLHSGNFHGFRAHRQVTTDHSEVYNVDVRLTNPPVAPNFETAKADAGSEVKQKAPKFVNVADEAAEERPRIDATVPTDPRRDEVMEEAPGYDPADDDDDDDAHARPYRRKFMLWLGIGLAAIVAVVAAVFLIPEGEALDATPAGETEMTSAEGDGAQPAQAQVAQMTPEESADAEYLNGNAAWDLTKLKSPMGQELAKAITDGDLEGLANNAYFAVPGRCTNEQARQIVEMAWRAIGSPNERGNSRKMRQGVQNGSVVLRELVNSLARVRPSEGLNERPLPGAKN
ncbi:hypothetical protein [Paramuribaculum intestinale]|uniref:hypothetical protein n=1 Tax=Paramuribaculum intestinale TaxID=2094151 RepID=UPI0026F3E8B0|nr:hypothetical protein [Paramuribaculum intestinale]